MIYLTYRHCELAESTTENCNISAFISLPCRIIISLTC